MLKRFEVENFKGFQDRLILDLNARDYIFNKDIVKDGIVNKGLIYGQNASGKSNLGIALFDIVLHSSDKKQLPLKYLSNYLNLNSAKEYAEFKYVFQFDNDEITYIYHKKDPFNLIDERLFINDKLVLNYSYFNKDNNFIDKEISRNLKIELNDNKLSVLKFIYRNTPTRPTSPFNKMMSFINKMLWYRSASDNNEYSGFTNGLLFMFDDLYYSNKLDDYEKFLKENNIEYKFEWENTNGMHELYVVFPKNKKVPFLSIASKGTKSLFLYFYWKTIAFNKLSFLFIDDFDAFLRNEIAENILIDLNKNSNFQTLLTSHNTYLMQNKLTRPDCCFIMNKSKISSLSNLTQKEIREAHNLEKMYLNGAFNEE